MSYKIINSIDEIPHTKHHNIFLIIYWNIIDIFYYIILFVKSIFINNIPIHYSHNKHKTDIIFIQGIGNKWSFIKHLIDQLSINHKCFVIKDFGFQFNNIPHSALLLNNFIKENNIKKCILICYSKGGLIATDFMLKFNNSTIKNVITIGTPYSGSSVAKLIPHNSYRELLPNSEFISQLQNNIKNKDNKNTLHRIISIISKYDNFVTPSQNCYLEGGTNILVNQSGHHKILFSEDLIRIIEKYSD